MSHYEKANRFSRLLPLMAAVVAVAPLAAQAQTTAQGSANCTISATTSFPIALNSGSSPQNLFKTTVSINAPASSSSSSSTTTAATAPSTVAGVDLTIDTGSAGVVVNKAAVPGALYQASQTPAHMFYSSSGTYLWGRSVNATLTFAATAGNPVPTLTTEPIAITATECTCTGTQGGGGGAIPAIADVDPGANCANLDTKTVTFGTTNITLGNCSALASSTKGMMGVGFGRSQSVGEAAINAFLQVPDMIAGTMHPGYVFTNNSVTLGLTAANTAGFAFTPLSATLAKTSYVTDWNESTAVVQLQGATPATAMQEAGALLVDTGIDYMFLSVPQANRPTNLQTTITQSNGTTATIVTENTLVTVSIPNATAPVFSYSFAASSEPGGASEKATPTTGPGAVGNSYAAWVGSKATSTNYNTGGRLLSFADYIFDPGCGRIGFKKLY